MFRLALLVLLVRRSPAFIAPACFSGQFRCRLQELEAAVVVALTREMGKNDALRRELDRDGRLKTIEVPCVMQTRDGEMEAALDTALTRHAWDWVVVTSPEAAKTLNDAASRTNVEKLRIATVGEATARALPTALASKFSPSKATAATLGAELPGNIGERILYPASALAAAKLEDVLSDRGFVVERVDAYTTVPAIWTEDELALAATADIVAFGSPSAVAVWVDRLGTAARAACIGKTTAQACDTAGFEPKARFPAQPGVRGWAVSIIEVVEDVLAAQSQ